MKKIIVIMLCILLFSVLFFLKPKIWENRLSKVVENKYSEQLFMNVLGEPDLIYESDFLMFIDNRFDSLKILKATCYDYKFITIPNFEYSFKDSLFHFVMYSSKIICFKNDTLFDYQL